MRVWQRLVTSVPMPRQVEAHACLQWEEDRAGRIRLQLLEYMDLTDPVQGLPCGKPCQAI